MGPLFFRAENLRAGEADAFRESGFNGAALFQSGERDVRDLVDGLLRASMGPLFFRAENSTGVFVIPRWECASMGPLFFRAENTESA